MWHGDMTEELENLYDKYYEMFGCEPGGYQEVDYGPKNYMTYVNDIKKAIKLKKELPSVAK